MKTYKIARADLQARTLALRAERKSLTYIANRLKLPRSTVRYWCEKGPNLGTPPGPRVKCTSNLPVIQFIYSEITHRRIPLAELSRRSGVAPETIRRWFRNEGAALFQMIEAVLNTLGYTFQWTPGPKQHPVEPSRS